MISFLLEHKGFWGPARKRSLYLGIILLILAIVIQITLGHYSERHAVGAPYASDLFLDNLPVIDLDFMIVGGALGLWVIVWWILCTRPRYLLFGIKVVALYIVCRAFFITLTHLGAYPRGIVPGPDNIGFSFYQLFTFQGNYFFSGHTGFPFLAALIFWNNKQLRWFFLFATCIFALTVLFAHVHYSIDVFAAPFIVYGTYVIASKLFPDDYELTL